MSLYCGDNLPILKSLPSESVDLVYLDPPFNSGRNYFQSDKQAFTDVWRWSDESESLLDEVGLSALVEFMGRNGLSAYLVMMAARLVELHRILKPTGSFYLHCDPTSSHYLKLVLDAIFCPQGGEFQNEIVWCYSIGGKSKNKFGKKHDVILFYTKSGKDIHIFNGKAASILRKPNSHMKVGIDADGREYQEKKDRKSGKVYRYYLDEGKIAEDYWTDIETLNREDRERLGYPTQKPEALLERIIKASSNEGDVVLDAYCGCGTSLAVAQNLNRKWIGIDMNPDAIELAQHRLNQPLQLKLA